MIINEHNIKKMTSLHAACLSGNKAIVKLLLDNGANIRKRDHKNFCPLHYAVVKDNVEVVNEGLECGIGLSDYKDIKEGDTIEILGEVEV